MAERLSDDQIERELTGSRWAREGDAIVRERELENFKAAVAFVDRVAEAAEAAGHHPDILIHDYKHVRLTLSTHSEGGLTQADLGLAKTIDGLV